MLGFTHTSAPGGTHKEGKQFLQSEFRWCRGHEALGSQTPVTGSSHAPRCCPEPRELARGRPASLGEGRRVLPRGTCGPPGTRQSGTAQGLGNSF